MDENEGTHPTEAPTPPPEPERPAAPEPAPPAAQEPATPPPAPPAAPTPPPPSAPPGAPSASQSAMGSTDKNKVVAGILAILLGSLGIHKFYLGYTTEGIIMAVVTVVGSIAFGLGPLVMGVIGLIEGIMYLTKTDQDFYETYVAHKKAWF